MNALGLSFDYHRRARSAGSVDHFVGGIVSMVPDTQQLFATGAGGGVTLFNQHVLPDLTNVHAVHWVCETHAYSQNPTGIGWPKN